MENVDGPAYELWVRDEQIKALEQELKCAREEIRKLEGIAYLGEHHFPDLTYKARFEELLDAARQAFGALVGSLASDDSVQGRARDRLRPFVI